MAVRVHAVAALCSGGAHCDAPDADGWTALHHAAAHGHADAVAALVGADAAIDLVRRANRPTNFVVSNRLKN